jgi:hypothetical protein
MRPGVPEKFMDRSKEVLLQFEAANVSAKVRKKAVSYASAGQTTLFG